MAPTYTVQFDNKSGTTHRYIISQELNVVEGLDDNLWPLVLFDIKVPTGGSAGFSVPAPDPYYAYALTTEGQPGHGTIVDVVLKQPVTLGTETVKGTTVEYSINDGVQDLQIGSSKGGFANYFEIRTAPYPPQDAKEGHLIGYGSEDQPWSAFKPEPGVEYQLQPSKVFYLNFIDLTTGSIINTKVVGKPLTLDFNQLDGPVKVTHNRNGMLTIDK